jgi:hypothetical protein
MADKTSSNPESVPSHIRRKILNRDDHRCRLCGQKGNHVGGSASLQVHHRMDIDTDVPDPHAEKYLLTLCRSCHNWGHKRPSVDDIPISLSADERSILLPHDIEILEELYEDGPLSTSELVERITPEIGYNAVRERLWLLMGVDNLIENEDHQLIDQNATTGKWGTPEQIDDSERGRIPIYMEPLLLRAEDERVRRALAAGYSRETVADIFQIHERQTYYKRRRAAAYEFPLDELVSVGRPSTAADKATESVVHPAPTSGSPWIDACWESSPVEQFDDWMMAPAVYVNLTKEEQNALLRHCIDSNQTLGRYIKEYVESLADGTVERDQ